MWKHLSDDVWSIVAMSGPVLGQVSMFTSTLDVRSVAAFKIQRILKRLRHRKRFQIGDRVVISRKVGLRYATVISVAEITIFRFEDKPNNYIFSETPYETFRIRVLQPWYQIDNTEILVHDATLLV